MSARDERRLDTASTRLLGRRQCRSMLLRGREDEPRSWTIVIDDGYRLWGRCLAVDAGEPWMILEYKHSDVPGVAWALIDLIFRDWS